MPLYECPECGDEFPYRAAQLDHVRNEHGVMKPKELE